MTVLLAAPILLTLTLLVSGLAKLGARQGTEDAMTSLRLPLRSFHRSVANVLPVVEIVLALGLWIPSVPLQVLIAMLVAVLMLAYLVIIARALTLGEPVECSCFGTLASPTVSRTTLGRNLVLVLLAIITLLSASSGAMTLALVQVPLSLVGLGVALLLAIVLTVLTLGGSAEGAAATKSTGEPAEGSARAQAGPRAGAPAGEQAASVAAPTAGGRAPELAGEETAEEPADEELLDYERAAIPGGVLQQPSGRLITLTQLTAQSAALLVFVSEGCGPCERVLDRADGWIEALSPFMQVKFVFSRPIDQLRERTTQRVGEHALHDLQFTARSTLGGKTAPSAVLLGADGLLAGGPVDGGSAVIEFVEAIQEQLAGAADDAPEDAELSPPAR